MKTFLYIFSFLFLHSLFCQDDIFLPNSKDSVEIIHHSFFHLGYSEHHEQALWVAYELTNEELYGKVERTNNFREDPSVTTGSATLTDYKNSGYDRGHLIPAADLSFDELAMNESFYLSNMSPQVPSFNRGIWKSLEEQIRYWTLALRKLYIITGPIILESDLKIGANEVSVPAYFYKVLYCQDSSQAIGFLMENKSGNQDLLTYSVDVDSVEFMSGLDFFPQLDTMLQNQLESTFSEVFWLSLTSQVPMIATPTPAQPSKNAICQGITESGSQCKRKVSQGEKHCWQHRNTQD